MADMSYKCRFRTQDTLLASLTTIEALLKSQLAKLTFTTQFGGSYFEECQPRENTLTLLIGVQSSFYRQYLYNLNMPLFNH